MINEGKVLSHEAFTKILETIHKPEAGWGFGAWRSYIPQFDFMANLKDILDNITENVGNIIIGAGVLFAVKYFKDLAGMLGSAWSCTVTPMGAIGMQVARHTATHVSGATIVLYLIYSYPYF